MEKLLAVNKCYIHVISDMQMRFEPSHASRSGVFNTDSPLKFVRCQLEQWSLAPKYVWKKYQKRFRNICPVCNSVIMQGKVKYIEISTLEPFFRIGKTFKVKFETVFAENYWSAHVVSASWPRKNSIFFVLFDRQKAIIGSQQAL